MIPAMAGNVEIQISRLLDRGLAQLGIDVDDEALSRLGQYCLELEKWSRKVNLIAKNTPLEDIIEKHFLDSLTLVPILDHLNPRERNLLDVGTGAGFPGLVVKVARTGWDVTLLEPRERRVAFLRHVIRQLCLKGVSPVSARIEEGRLPDKKYAVITGRAVADIPRFLAMVAAEASQDTLVVCMQGETGRHDLEEGDMVNAFVCRKVWETYLPFSRNKRFLLLFSKDR